MMENALRAEGGRGRLRQGLRYRPSHGPDQGKRRRKYSGTHAGTIEHAVHSAAPPREERQADARSRARSGSTSPRPGAER